MTHSDYTVVGKVTAQRQVAKVLHFPADLASYIHFDHIAAYARMLNADWDVRYTAGACTVTVFWSDGGQ